MDVALFSDADTSGGFTKGQALSPKVFSAYQQLSLNTMNPSLEQLIETLFWSETDNADETGGEPLDTNYDITDVDEASLAGLHKHFQSFVEEAEKELTEKFGDKWSSIDDFYTGSASGGFYTEHDFILTANRHGCGFWEKGDWQDGVGDILTRLAQKYGEINTVVGDNGKVYIDLPYHFTQSTQEQQ